MAAKFELQITSQYWLGESPEQQTHDGCSHGGIRAVIGGTVVTSDDEYGISQSALALLRTIEQDHSPAEPVTGSFLLCHGCGYPWHFGCSNFGTDWVVRHESHEVFLSQPILVDATSGNVEFDLRVRVGAEDCFRQVVSFAETAGDFYLAARPRSVEEYEQDDHDAFWVEFDERLERAKAALHAAT